MSAALAVRPSSRGDEARRLLAETHAELARLARLSCRCTGQPPTVRVPCLSCCAEEALQLVEDAGSWMEGTS